MKLVLDTSVLIDHLRNDQRAVDLLVAASRGGDQLFASVISRTEVIRGMRSDERTRTYRLLDALTWVDVTVAIADRAGDLARTYRRSHPGIDVADFTVAACAQHLEARLVTRNVKHFPMFPELEPAYS